MPENQERLPATPVADPTPSQAGEPAPGDDACAAENAALIRKATRKITAFVIATAIVVAFVLLRQGQRLFIFNFADANLNATPASRFFSYLTYAFLIFTAGYAIFFSGVVRRRKALADSQACASFPQFKKRYDLFDLLGVIPAFLAVIVVLNAFIFSPAVVEGPSMEPTFYEGDAVIVYHLDASYAASDIVIFARGDKLLIKRLIGVPGDHLQVSAAGVYLNGDLVEAVVADYHVPYDGEIPEGYYFVLGDHRDQSNDSRAFGLVPADDMLGKVVVKIDLF